MADNSTGASAKARDRALALKKEQNNFKSQSRLAEKVEKRKINDAARASNGERRKAQGAARAAALEACVEFARSSDVKLVAKMKNMKTQNDSGTGSVVFQTELVYTDEDLSALLTLHNKQVAIKEVVAGQWHHEPRNRKGENIIEFNVVFKYNRKEYNGKLRLANLDEETYMLNQCVVEAYVQDKRPTLSLSYARHPEVHKFIQCCHDNALAPSESDIVELRRQLMVEMAAEKLAKSGAEASAAVPPE
jgi:hypothetical protein